MKILTDMLGRINTLCLCNNWEIFCSYRNRGTTVILITYFTCDSSQFSFTSSWNLKWANTTKLKVIEKKKKKTINNKQNWVNHIFYSWWTICIEFRQTLNPGEIFFVEQFGLLKLGFGCMHFILLKATLRTHTSIKPLPSYHWEYSDSSCGGIFHFLSFYLCFDTIFCHFAYVSILGTLRWFVWTAPFAGLRKRKYFDDTMSSFVILHASVI